MAHQKSSLRGQRYKIVLRVDSGLNLGSHFHIKPEGRTLMGRQIEADIALEDVKASRTHASVDSQVGGYFLTDMGSTNGTFLNGVSVQTAQRLALGDEIRIGSTVLKVELLEDFVARGEDRWKESTRVVLVQGLAATPKLTVIPKKERTFGRDIEDFLVSAKQRRRELPERHGSWMGVLILVSLVGAALWTSLKPVTSNVSSVASSPRIEVSIER